MNDAPINAMRGLLPRNMLPLGFGCGGLLGGRSRSQSLRLLEVALDCGITYFDTARMYGLGDAEGILGELMPRHRDRIVLVSKAGILPTDRSIPLRLLRRGVKLLHATAPALRGHIKEPPPAQPRFGLFEVADLRKSLETSLRQLRTDHLDIFLLHECKLDDVANPELLSFLQSLRTEGKIRAFGLATGIEQTLKIALSEPALAAVVQIPNSIWDMNIERLPTRPDRLTITHSCLAHGFRSLVDRLPNDHVLAGQWHALTGIEARDTAGLARLFLAHALRVNPGGVVLFSSSKPENIRANVELAQRNPLDQSQIDGLTTLLQAEWGADGRA